MVGRSRVASMYPSGTRRPTVSDSLQYVSGALRHGPPPQTAAALAIDASPASSTSGGGVVDPYSRPMAVKDLADASQPRPVVVRATGGHGYGRQSSVLQTNSFMRPRSASLVPLEAVMGCSRREAAQQPSRQAPSGGQVAGHVTQVRGGPSHQFRYSTRSLSTQWLNGLAQAGVIQSGSTQSPAGVTVAGPSRCLVTGSPSQVLATNSQGQVVQLRYGTSNAYLLNGTQAAGGNGFPYSSGRESNFSANRTPSGANHRGLATPSEHGFPGTDPTPGVGSGLEFDEAYPSESASLFNQRDSRMGRYDEATSLRGHPERAGATQQGIPTRGTSSLSTIVTSGTTTSLHTFGDSVPRGGSNDVAQARRQVKVDMGIVSALVDKMRNITVESDAISGSVRNRFEPRVHPRRNGSSVVDVSKDDQRTLENSESRGARATPTVTSTVKPESCVTSKPPSGATAGGLGPRNQLICQEKLKRMPVTNTFTGSPFPTKPLNIQDLSHLANPRPLPPAPRKQNASDASIHKASRPSSDKPKSRVQNGSHSSPSCVDTVEEESLLGNDDTELDSLDDEDGLDDLNSYLSDEESSRGTSCSSPSPTTTQGRSRSYSAKLPAKAIVRRYHDNDVPSRKISTGSKSAGNIPRPAALSVILNETPGVDSDPMPSLTDSLFSNVPPTINFVLEGQKVEPLPNEFRKLLKWRMSPITPNVVKQCIARSGFKPTLKSHTWLGYWGKHMKPPGFKTIRDYQKMNHFPGTFQLGRKDRLWRNLSRMQSRFGKKEFDFFPQTYILPADLANLKTIFEDGSNKNKWIIKPPASARGIGIQVVHKWSEIPKNRPVIVQRYLAHPYLINDSKFDLRIYVYVTSFDPLRIYVYDDGLARFASVKYSYSLKNLHNRFMHLTNYSINKRNVDYESNSDEDICQGHKWSLKALWIYLQSKGIDSSAIWVKIKDLVIKTIISTESIINSMVKANVRRRYSCHELFGFDVLLDEKLKPWVIEVNISPSLHSNSQLDINVKGGMIRDLFNLAGFMIPEKNDVLPNPGPAPDLSTYEPSNDVCLDRRLWTNQKSADEKAKHLYYTQRHSDEQVQATILDVLTPDDIRMLTETVDENSRRGDFQRVFPSATSRSYHALFEQQRYYNLLLEAWSNKYPTTETRGISLLESFCRKGIHLQNPTSKTKHQWVAPALSSFTKDIKNAGSPTTNSQPSLSESPYAR